MRRQKRNAMVRRVVAVTIGLLLFVTGISGLAQAAGNSYPAAEVIGQTDGSGNPVFNTKAINNNKGTLDGSGMEYPAGTVIDTVHHRLFIADCSNSRILVYNLDSHNNLVSHTADNVLGQPTMADSNWTASSATTMNCPNSIAYDGVHDRLFVPDAASRLLVFDLSNGVHDNMQASYVLGQANFTDAGDDVSNPFGCRAISANVICNPWGQVVYNPTTNMLFVPDWKYHRIMVFDFSQGIHNNMDAVYVLGQNSLTTTAGSQATKNGIDMTFGMALDVARQKLFVGDYGNNRVLVFNLANGIHSGMDASNVLGQSDYVTTTARLDQRSITNPYAMAYDSVNNRLYVSDDNNNRITVFDVQTIADNQPAVAVIGAPDFTTGNTNCSASAASQYNFCDNENGMAIDTTNNRLYVSDSGFNRELVYNFVNFKTAAGALPNGKFGTSYNQSLATEDNQGSVTYQITSGALPPGLNFSSTTGLISGTPAQYGTYSFEVAASDNAGDVGTFVEDPQYSITIPSPISPDTGFGTPTENPLQAALCFVLALLGLASTSFALRRLAK